VTTVLAIDPGRWKSGWAVVAENPLRLHQFGISDNADMYKSLREFGIGPYDVLAVEMVRSFGESGDSLYETAAWVGAFAFAEGMPNKAARLVYRSDERLLLLPGERKISDAAVRRAVIEAFPQTGGGKEPAIGTKKEPGPLYGVKSHVWQAIGVGLTYLRDPERFKPLGIQREN
jgi:hypothetical protein